MQKGSSSALPVRHGPRADILTWTKKRLFFCSLAPRLPPPQSPSPPPFPSPTSISLVSLYNAMLRAVRAHREHNRYPRALSNVYWSFLRAAVVSFDDWIRLPRSSKLVSCFERAVWEVCDCSRGSLLGGLVYWMRAREIVTTFVFFPRVLPPDTRTRI